MLPLLAPILAQLVTLNLGDRTEQRYVSSTVAGEAGYFETDTRPTAGLSLGFRRSDYALNYAPSLTLTPTNGPSRELVVFHNVSLVGSYRLKQTTISVYDALGYGERNLGAEVVAGARTNETTPPPTMGGTPGSPGNPPATGGSAGGTTGGTTPSAQQPATQIATLNRIVRLATFTTGVHVAHGLTHALTLGADVGYVITGGADASSRDRYPLFRGPRVALSLTNHLTRRDDLTTAYSAQYGSSPNGPRVWVMQQSLALNHRLATRSSVHAGGGISLSKDMEPNGLIAYSIYPTVDVGVVHALLFERGTLTLSAGVVAAPVLDPVAVAVDPRLGPTAGIGWVRDRFSINANGSAATSIGNPTYQGGLKAAYGSVRAGYRLSKLFSVDTGVRGAWQSFQGQIILPFTWAVFVGVSVGLPIRLAGR